MFSQFNHKQKTIILLLGAFTVLILGYSISVVPTLEIKAELEQKEQLYNDALIGPDQIKKLENKLTAINNSVGSVDVGFEDFQDRTLELIIPFSNSNQLTVNEINKPHYFESNGYEIQTMCIKVIGSYKNTSLLIDHIQNQDLGRVNSIRYNLKKDQKTKKEYLETTLIIQNYKAL